METGGLEQTICHLVRHLDPARFRAIVGCLDSGGVLLDQIGDTPYFIEARKPGIDFGLILRLVRYFRDRQIQIVHTHNQAAQFYAGIAARLARVPILICTEHSRHHIQGVLRRILEKRVLCHLSDVWVEVSQELLQESLLSDGLPLNKLKVVHNGIPIPSLNRSHAQKDEIRSRLGLCGSDLVILMAARLDPVKNHKLMLKTVKELKGREIMIRLVLAGDGDEMDSLKRMVNQLDISGQVSFLGNRSDVPELMTISDIFVLCSHSEGLPLSLLEAAASRVPILVTPGANQAGFVQDQINGWVARPEPAAMADRIQVILSNQPQAKDMASVGFEKVKSLYSVETMVRAYEDLYLGLAQKKGLA